MGDHPQMANDPPMVSFATQVEMEGWLERNHEAPEGIWLKIAKKASGIASVSYAEAVELALCFGWIDGQRKSFDESWFLQRFTPRRARSRWSRINRDKADELIAAGRMRPSGLAAVEAAKGDGRWDAAYEPQSSAELPADLVAELARDAAAADFFATLNSANRYAIVYRLNDAKRPETRERRLRKYMEMLRREERIHP